MSQEHGPDEPHRAGPSSEAPETTSDTNPETVPDMVPDPVVEPSGQPDEESAVSSAVDVDELLINPEEQPAPDSDDPFGEPGEPLSRHSAFYKGFWTAIGALIAIALGLAVRQADQIIVLILVAVFFAVGLNPIVEWLMHRGIRRRWAVLFVTLAVIGILAIFVISLVPVLRDQIEALIHSAPGWLDDLQRNKTVSSLDRKYHVIAKIRQKLQDPQLAQTIFGSLFTVGLAVLSALLNAFIVFVLTLYFLSALPEIKRACYSLVPASRRMRVTFLGDEILRRVGGYVVGAFLIATCAGVSSLVFLEIAGLSQYAVALALVVAILDFIPLVGATIGAAIVTIIGFANSPGLGIACLVFYVVYQQIENYVIYPRIMRSSVDVPGIVTVIAVLIGGTLEGVVGALLAIPTAAAVLLILREVVVRRQEHA